MVLNERQIKLLRTCARAPNGLSVDHWKAATWNALMRRGLIDGGPWFDSPTTITDAGKAALASLPKRRKRQRLVSTYIGMLPATLAALDGYCKRHGLKRGDAIAKLLGVPRKEKSPD